MNYQALAPPKRSNALAMLFALVVCALVALVPSSPVFRLIPAYLLLMLAPGLAIYSLVESRQSRLEALVWATLVSPVLIAGLSVAAMWAGASSVATGRLLVITATGLGIPAILRHRSGWEDELAPRQAWVLGGFILLLVALCAYLPLTEEWWRIRSDAMFHRAVIAEISQNGVPPHDPYFYGFRLQYMWFFHALILNLSRAAGVSPPWMMVAFNIQALIGLVAAAYAFSGVFKQSFWHRMTAAVMMPLGLNSLFWVFLPIKMGRALTGEVRGWEEISRQLSLSPLSYEMTYRFMHIWGNAEFFLDKYMVATAFSLGLSLMVVAWFAATDYLRSRRRSSLLLLFFSIAGMFGYHTLVGVISFGGIVGGAALLWVFGRRTDGFSVRKLFAIGAACGAGVLVLVPYLIQATSGRDSAALQASNMLTRLAGILIAVALAVGLASLQRDFWRGRDAHTRFLAFGMFSLLAVSLVINVSQANAGDKLGYFCFIPLVPVAAWSLVDFVSARRTPRARASWAVILAFVCFVPANALGFIGCYATPIPVAITAGEYALSEWVRENTERDAVFIDLDDKMFLMITGPRRYVYGRHSYAQYWGYDRIEMSRRYHARETLYAGDRPLDATTLEVLAGIEPELYVVVRPQAAARTNVEMHERYFQWVYRQGELGIVRVDKSACRQAAADLPRVSDEALLEESGL